MHLAVARDTRGCSPSYAHCTPNWKSRNPRTAVCSETHDVFTFQALSRVPVVEEIQQEPHCPCCFTEVITPCVVLSTTVARRAPSCSSVPRRGKLLHSLSRFRPMKVAANSSCVKLADSLTLVVRFLMLLAQMVSPLDLRFPKHTDSSTTSTR